MTVTDFRVHTKITMKKTPINK